MPGLDYEYNPPCAHSCENDRTARARLEDSVSFHLIRSVARLSFAECYTDSVLWGCPGVSASSRIWGNLSLEWEFLQSMQRNLLLLCCSLAMICQGESSGFPSAWEVRYLPLVSQAFQFFFLLSFLPGLCSSLFLIGQVVRGEHLVNNTCRLCNELVWVVQMSAAFLPLTAPPNVKEVWGCSGQEGTCVLRARLS